jgi:hypothetical protein
MDHAADNPLPGSPAAGQKRKRPACSVVCDKEEYIAHILFKIRLPHSNPTNALRSMDQTLVEIIVGGDNRRWR